jgi:putative sterol carrier protein
MSENTEGYFQSLAATGYQPLLHRVSGSIRFDLSDSAGGHKVWRVGIDHGNLDVRKESEGGGDDADCVISGPEDELQRILSGQDSFAAAFVRGAITVQGDHTLAQNLRRFSPPADNLVAEEVDHSP